MRLQPIALTASLLTPLIFIVPTASASERHAHDEEHHYHHQQGAHVHGMAKLNLALEGKETHIELDSPAANIVGFEHAPSSQAEHAALDKAVGTLQHGDHLFQFNGAAGCRMEKAMIRSTLLGEAHDEHSHDHDPHHEAHRHDHQTHEHEEHREKETHSDIKVVYHFECRQPSKLDQLTVELFETFPAMEQLEVQYVIGGKQGAVELTARNPVVKF